MKKYISLLYFFCVLSSYAYTPSALIETQAIALSKKINAYIERLPGAKKTTIFQVFSTQLPLLQNKLIPTGDITKMYLFEYIRRHLPAVKMIDTSDLIDDDNREFTWTHAPKGFDIIYSPYDTPAFGNLDTEKKYTTLINGSYFGRTEGGNYHAGLLWFGDDWYARFIDDDPQLTHILCRDKSGIIHIYGNSWYLSEDQLVACDVALQFGPLIYQLQNGQVTQNLAQKTYIGASHTRTVMVIFTHEDNTQDVWFLTVYGKMTLAQVRDVALSETRFIGTYRDISILNLDG